MVRCEFDRSRSRVLFQAMKLRRPGDWNDPRLLRKEPSEGYLSRCRLLPFCDLAKQINQRLIRFSGFRLKVRDSGAEICAIEFCIFGDRASEQALSKSAK